MTDAPTMQERLERLEHLSEKAEAEGELTEAEAEQAAEDLRVINESFSNLLNTITAQMGMVVEDINEAMQPLAEMLSEAVETTDE